MAIALSVVDFLAASGPILDVRSPGEHGQGHIPGAIAFPLFSDAERAQVGICYKQEGREAAVELGFAIAGAKFAGFLREAKALAPQRQVRVHCWRGGMRSGAVAWVLELGGFDVSTLSGGYKAFRRWSLEAVNNPRPILVLGGMTGTQKTKILHALADRGEQVIDLEGLAHHRGSSFGALMLPPQPSNEQFENRVASQWAAFSPTRRVWIEAESRRIGLCCIPSALFTQMEQAMVLEVVRPKAERLAFLVELYAQAPVDALVVATERIRKRLGGLRTQEAIALLQQHRFTEAFDLLLAYYDQTYEYDLQRRPVLRQPIDMTGLTADQSATRLIETADALLPSTPTAAMPL